MWFLPAAKGRSTRWSDRFGLRLPSVATVVILGLAAAASAGSWRVPSQAARLQNPTVSTQESIGRGAVIFAKRCAVCHGDRARGDGPSSLSLGIPPTDLTSAEVQGQPDGVLFWKITLGRGPMPNWDLILKEEDRWHVINYLRAVSKE